jgi:hypothetical protein
VARTGLVGSGKVLLGGVRCGWSWHGFIFQRD